MQAGRRLAFSSCQRVCMPYLSKNNPRAFAGTPSAWARNLSAWGHFELLESRSRRPFVARHETDRTCLIVPKIEPDRVTLLVLYSIRRALTPDRMTDSIPDLIGQWDNLSRGYALSEIDPRTIPHFRGLDHNATVRAANELTRAPFVFIPSLAEIDAALLTGLDRLGQDQIDIVRPVRGMGCCDLGETRSEVS